MFKHKKTNIHPKIKMKKTSRFRCCFYCVYNLFYIALFCVFREVLNIYVFILSVNSKRHFLSTNRFLGLYKLNALIQY